MGYRSVTVNCLFPEVCVHYLPTSIAVLPLKKQLEQVFFAMHPNTVFKSCSSLLGVCLVLRE